MNGVAREGRTVLFVSHDMTAIDALCSRCMLLVNGELQLSGTPHEVTSHYLGMTLSHNFGRSNLDPKVLKRTAGLATMMEVTVSNGDAVPVAGIPMGTALGVHVSFRATKPIHPVLGVNVKTASGFTLFGNNNRVMSQTLSEIQGEGLITMVFPAPPLMPGRYHLDLWLGDPAGDYDIVLDAISFEVFARDVFGTGKLPPDATGPLYMTAYWTLETATLPAPCRAETANV